VERIGRGVAVESEVPRTCVARGFQPRDRGLRARATSVDFEFASSSALFQGKRDGDFSLPATSMSTSTVARVLCSGFITGPATVVNGSIDPDSGVLSTHDSRNE
jgi:hypothetical protein